MPKPKFPTVAKKADERVRGERLKAAGIARQTATAALKADEKHDPVLSVAERGRHQEALKAANRVEQRLRNPSGSKGKKKGGKAKTASTPASRTPASRRKPFESLLPGNSARKLEGVNALIEAGKKNR